MRATDENLIHHNKVNPFRPVYSTSLLGNGEVQSIFFWDSLAHRCLITDASSEEMMVVGDSRLGRVSICECKRSVRIRILLKQYLTEVRTFIVAKKLGNSSGAKGGRLMNVQKPNKVK